MPSSLTLDLTDAERRTLRDARKRHDKPYVRERAAALLKIEDGWSGNKVAQEGLLQPRVPDTVYTWYHDWQDHGIAALYIEEGRGLWARFPPEHSSEAEAREAVMGLVRRTPRSVGLDRTRWTLGLLAQKMGAIGDIPEDITRGGFSKLLGRLGISYKRDLSANAKSRSRLRRKAPIRR